MRRDPAAAEPTAAGASPPTAAGATDAVVIDVEGRGGAVIVEIEAAAAPGARCRVCQLGAEGDGAAAAGESEVIRIGCGCKDELGAAHRQCAEAWFRIKGDRVYQILDSEGKLLAKSCRNKD
ncbi:hypothetical protein ACP70R_036839 [Stipagrostis hirtigluma subsp. patula]